jgi:peroxiredoxin
MHIFNKMNCEMVFMVNGGREQHKHFRDTFKVRPRILIDEDGAVGEAYGFYQVNCKGSNYNYYMASTVYLIDAEGKVSCFWLLSGPRGRPDPECLLGILAYAEHNNWKY